MDDKPFARIHNRMYMRTSVLLNMRICEFTCVNASRKVEKNTRVKLHKLNQKGYRENTSLEERQSDE